MLVVTSNNGKLIIQLEWPYRVQLKSDRCCSVAYSYQPTAVLV